MCTRPVQEGRGVGLLRRLKEVNHTVMGKCVWIPLGWIDGNEAQPVARREDRSRLLGAVSPFGYRKQHTTSVRVYEKTLPITFLLPVNVK